eukprot:Gregarina_sp_Poly_1__9887@NODE_643_length_6990_cov_94_573595_g61_i1_p3_GENE_NODE_643_length_6990_cov_94_573595_g61_i1NODE_643_length_6990_cov_94_573595_g61_i1_p3_ORF_typecomplete_len262_score41_01UQ_con/PF00179_26/1_2e14_NODE_643_length_6990_cov_94_573595_g61_i161786
MLDKADDDQISRAELTLMMEYCVLCDWVIDSCISLGHYGSENSLEWRCLIVPSSGIYENQILKFLLKFNEEYPAVLPECQFVDQIPNHPLIDKSTGSLDLKIRFQQWKPEVNGVVQILGFIRRIFHDPKFLTFQVDRDFVKQPQFLEIAETKGLDVAAAAAIPGPHKEMQDPVFRNLLDDIPEIQGGAPKLKDIQAAVDSICNRQTADQRIFNRGVHYRHDELADTRTEADSLYNLLLNGI